MEDIKRSIHDSLSKICEQLVPSQYPSHTTKVFVSNVEKQIRFFSSEEFEQGNKTAGLAVMEKILHYSKILEDLSTQIKIPLEKLLKENITIMIVKLNFLFPLIYSAFKLDKEDLLCLPENHPRRLSLKSVTTTILLDNQKEIHQQLKKFYKTMNSMKAVFYTTSKYKESTSRNLITGFLFLYYMQATKKAERQARLFDISNNADGLKFLLGMGQSKMMKKHVEGTFPPIACNKLVYLPKLSEHILHSSQHPESGPPPTNPREADYKFSFTPEGTRVQVRVLSKTPLPSLDSTHASSLPVQQICEKLIIQVHGGAFVAFSSFDHQDYTRDWATELNTPIFSIDYGLSPEHPFPEGLDDVWQAYTWLVNHAREFFGVLPNKIVLFGDSAGGNLVSALTIKAITSGFRVPDALLLVYPLSNMQAEYYSPSALIALEDQILPTGVYEIALNSYIHGRFNLEDPLISPLFCSEEVARKFPRTEIMITQNDSLSGDSYRFGDKLLRAGVQVHITEFPGVIHGAMSFANEQGIPLYRQVDDHGLNLMKRLLD